MPSTDARDDFETWFIDHTFVGDAHVTPVDDAWKMYRSRRHDYDTTLTKRQFVAAMTAKGFTRRYRKVYYKRIPVFIGVAVGDVITRLTYAMARCEAEADALDDTAA